ncbi:MAG: hypothetical protein AAFO94_05205 [Bacteroidota bacterium]
MKHSKLTLALVGILLMAWVVPTHAQYFGQNKPHYESFDFKVYETPTFEIYHYLQNRERLNDLAQQSEHWYHIHKEVLQDTFKTKNPVIFYNDHADFQQTNSINGAIGVGTGGVTEAFKNRVIMPLGFSNEQTHHVLGHELVHAFQYNMILRGDSTSMRNLQNLPLWMVEGLAEYMSIGRVDAHTAMWMRDAVLNDDVPSLKDLNNYAKYFPYRYGQAFWAFLTGMYGDDVIEPFFVATAKYGMKPAVQSVLNTNFETLSGMWQSAMKTYYEPLLGDKKERTIGKVLLDKSNSGKLNISPVLSPNGTYVIFLSEKDVFSTDLYLAKARSGEVVRKVASTVKSGHIDDFAYIESSGTWSPDSKRFAFVAFKKGKNVLVINEVDNGKTVEEIFIPGVPAFTNPIWSPDRKHIVVSGLVDGQIDLYSYNIKTEKVTQLTNDKYTEMQPAFSADGSQLLFATDQLSMTRGRTNGKWTFNVAVMDMDSQSVEIIDVFFGANNLNPVFDHEGNILFLSNRDGFRDIYKYDVATQQVFQQTNFLSGVSGITQYAPALTASTKRDRVLFSHFSKNGYRIFQASSEQFLNKEVDPQAVDFSAATLPVVGLNKKDIVNQNLNALDQAKLTPITAFSETEYKPKFKLDYIGGGTGVGVGNTFGQTTTGLQGGVDMLFSDILGNNSLYAGLSLNGEIYDFGGTLAYINKKSKIYWGGSISHLPFRTGNTFYAGRDTFTLNEGGSIVADKLELNLLRIFEDKASVFAQYPISKSLRAEIGTSFSRYSFRQDRFDNYYNAFGQLIYQERERVDAAPESFNSYRANAALVGDNSRFGLASPMQGYRYRFGVERFMGEWDFTSTTLDFRKYHWIRPVSLGFRAMHYGRYGKDARAFPSLYAGDPTLVRGYSFNTLDRFQEYGFDLNQVTGSKLFVTNFEVRLPFTGPEQLALIKSKFLFSELAFFVDGGVAWNDFSDFQNNPEGPNSFRPVPLFSTGISARVNVFNALILEPYLAMPIQENARAVFGVNIVPGW